MKKLLVVALVLTCMLFSIVAQGQGEAGEKTYTLRFGHTLTPEDEFHKAYERWGQRVSEKTGGKLKIEVYPSSQLGVEEDVLEQIKQGSNVGWQTDPGRLGNYVNEFSIFYMPFFLEGGMADVEKLLKSAEVKSWCEKLEKEHHIKVISYAWVQGNRSIMANKIAKSPSELSGMLIRTAPAPAWVACVNSLGCKAVALAYGEMYNGIQTKVVDGCELPYAAAKNMKINEVAKYIIETNHIFQLNVMVCSADWFNALPDDYKTILVEECDKAGLEASKVLVDGAAADRQYLVDHGMTLIPNSELDMEAFRKAGDQAYKELGLLETKAKIFKELGK
ncbi:MAG: C4-dicarboxylate TRAP transporter substrate-binding protein [Spirochaetales bacterium]|nr:C4-dicarboxylate TRAP transporter substrate-binding protein [Spirochaetales bacterium]